MSENAGGKKAKGAVMVAMAMAINGARQMDWVGQTELTPQDLELIHKGIMSSKWYDAGLWERMGMAVFKLIGQGKPENAFTFGHGILAETLLKIYKGPLVANDPKAILAKFGSFYGTNWYNFGSASFTPTDKGGVFRITHEDGVPVQAFNPPMVRGLLTRFIEENGGKNVKADCEEEAQANDRKLTKLTVNLAWE